MEEAGLKGLDALSHGLDLIKKTGERLLPSIFQNLKVKLGLVKVEDKNFQKEFEDLLASAETDMTESELLKNRRERVPIEYLAYFMAILVEAKNNQSLSTTDFDGIKNFVKAVGIQGMTNEKTWNVITDANLKKKLAELAATLKGRYQVFNTRFGNEIILDKSSY